jgi:hypothetical protein
MLKVLVILAILLFTCLIVLVLFEVVLRLGLAKAAALTVLKLAVLKQVSVLLILTTLI